MTTLADRISAMAALRPDIKIEGNGHTIHQIMQDCTRYVVRDDVIDIAKEIMGETGRAEMPWPLPLAEGETVFLESGPGRHFERMSKLQVGLLLTSGGIGGFISYAENEQNEPSWIFIPVTHDLENQEVTIVLEPKYRDRQEKIGWGVDLFLVVLHMIQQPRIVARRPVVWDERLQRSRRKSGKLPLLDYHEVVVHVTRAERAADARAQELQERHGVRLHRVRPHYRVRAGVVQRIAAYWRGSAELGVSLSSGHRVAR
jgi:hypothetical protein